MVSFNCNLKNTSDQLISATYNHDVLAVEQEAGKPLNALALAMQNLTKGEKRNISLKAQEAYGFYDPAKIILFPKNKLPKHIKVGETIQIAGKSGAIRSYKIMNLHGNMANLDGNHPLAGQDLIFEIETLAVRNATPSEIAEAANNVTLLKLH